VVVNVNLLPDGGLYNDVKTLLFIMIEVVSITPWINGDSNFSTGMLSLTNIATPPPFLPSLCARLTSLKFSNISTS